MRRVQQIIIQTEVDVRCALTKGVVYVIQHLETVHRVRVDIMLMERNVPNVPQRCQDVHCVRVERNVTRVRVDISRMMQERVHCVEIN